MKLQDEGTQVRGTGGKIRRSMAKLLYRASGVLRVWRGRPELPGRKKHRRKVFIGSS